MIKNIVIGCVIFFTGIYSGKKIRDHKANKQILYMQALAKEIKERNNQFVNNLSNAYHVTSVNDAKFTEFDEMLFEMWMD